MVDSDKEAKIDPINVKLAEFDIQTKTFLVDSICKTCCKQTIDDFIK